MQGSIGKDAQVVKSKGLHSNVAKMLFNLCPNFSLDWSLFVAICAPRVQTAPPYKPFRRDSYPFTPLSNPVSSSLSNRPGSRLLSLFCTCVLIVLSFLARTKSCVSASHTSVGHVQRDCQVNASLARMQQDEQGRFPSLDSQISINNYQFERCAEVSSIVFFYSF